MYLKDKISELPLNCLYSKGKVGCGGTSLAIEGDKPYVICVPFVDMIKNKLFQYPNERYTDNILGITNKTGKMEIKYYVRETAIPKIIVTYDSLGKVVECINPEDFYLLIDEYHLLFNAYSFRSKAIHVVLDHYKKFKAYTFMTATPLEEEFILEELKDLPYIEESWDNSIDVIIQSVKCNSVEGSTIKLIKDFLNNSIEGNAYLFVNSVDFIKSILNKIPELDESNTRIIYSKSNRSQLRLPNQYTTDEKKKINFLTSTVFEGSDLYDEDGRIIIISDPSKANTLLDISTSIQQIAGRIRNSKYINCITHLFKTTRYIDTTYDEFRQIVNNNIEGTQKAIIEFNNLSDYARGMLNEFTADAYIQKQNGYFIYDPNLAKIDLYNYKVVNGLYKCRVNLEQEYQKYNFDVKQFKDSAINVNTYNNIISFKEIIKQIQDTGEISEFALKRYPWLPDAINTLGIEIFSQLRYVQRDIKNLYLQKLDASIDTKIAMKLNSKIRLGEFYKPGEIKNILSKVYEDLNLQQSIKSSDIEKYYIVENKTKKINNTPIKGIIPVLPKYNIK